MSITAITNTKHYEDIADAIRFSKTANYQSELSKYREMYKGVVDPALILWDWEGTPLAYYTKSQALALTELPAPSTLPAYATVDHELLSFQEWNWSLADIKTRIQNHEGECLGVGAIYTTTDGTIHNYWNTPRDSVPSNIIMQKRGGSTTSGSGFHSYYSLNKINIPKEAINVSFQFAYTGIKHLALPSGMTEIPNALCAGCFNLSNISIPNSVVAIRINAFKECKSLKNIVIPNGVTRIEEYAFQACSSLKTVVMPNNIKNIYNYAFNACSSLTDISIPANATRISVGAFRYCWSLPRIQIPNNVLVIEGYAFDNCRSLYDILCTASEPILNHTNAFDNLPSDYRIYVPRANLSWFETATNWSTIYTQGHIVAIEDYIEYLESIGFDVDDYKEVDVNA